MKLFCFTCREHVLNTTVTFKLGGPYEGHMFEPAQKGGYWGRMFHHSAKRANLFCPRCEGLFMRREELLTEHGIVRQGQGSVDTSFSILAPRDHPLPGRIMKIDYSMPDPEVLKTMKDRADDAQREVKEFEHKKGEVVEQIPETPIEEPDSYICAQCGKEYKKTPAGKRWYLKHIESCVG